MPIDFSTFDVPPSRQQLTADTKVTTTTLDHHYINHTQPQAAKMPRCFMAKKLKYPYEQWKRSEDEKRSRSASPELVVDANEVTDQGKWCDTRCRKFA